MAIISSTGNGRVDGTGDDDIITSTADGSGQIHIYAYGGDDEVNLNFSSQDGYEKGHHARVGHGNAGGSEGVDVFNFTNVDNVHGRTVGRLEDFDASRDDIQIDGVSIPLANGSGTTAGYDWKVVEWDADTTDSAYGTQMWLVIDSGDGILFYALEGARMTIDIDGTSNNDTQESHFVQMMPKDGSGAQTEAAVWALAAVSYIDPVNYIPATDENGDPYVADSGGLFLNDTDNVISDLTDIIVGTGVGDVIAAGLNNDTVEAGSGADTVWGGSGNDLIKGQGGADLIFGCIGDDSISAGSSADTVEGGAGNDTLAGNADDDFLDGGDGNDDLNGGGEDDTLDGGNGNDSLKGSTGSDFVKGSSGADTVSGNAGDDTLWGGSGNDTLYGGGDSDELHGGSGNDVLKGGDGSDQFIFRQGWDQDAITDFSLVDDVLVFVQDDLWQGNLSEQDVVNTYASVVSGDVVFDFGNGDTLSLNGYSSLTGLSDSITLLSA